MMTMMVITSHIPSPIFSIRISRGGAYEEIDPFSFIIILSSLRSFLSSFTLLQQEVLKQEICLF
jgi:hypothetical protein